MTKFSRVAGSLLLLVFTALPELSGKDVILSPRVEGKDPDGLGEFVRIALEARLSEGGELTLLDRKNLSTSLAETQREEVEEGATEAKLEVKGADISVNPKITQFGKKVLMSYRVVNLRDSSYRAVAVDGTVASDPMELVEASVEKIQAAIGELSETDAAAEVELEKIDPDLPRFAFAMRIPETTTQDSNPDPAADKSLSRYLLDNGFEVVALSRPSQSVTSRNLVHL